jgi:hypothetical protein
MEFKAFPKIERLEKVQMVITQKIHGTNAQITIFEDTQGAPLITTKVLAGSRTKWIYPEDDNFGFARYVRENEAEIIEKLGMGTHFGEWAGPGINSSEGLTQKTFVLFDFWKYPPERALPKQMMVVPVLYQGELNLEKLDEVMADLKEKGSKLVPGFMRPEGVVVTVFGTRFKKVFDAEETQWTKGGVRVPSEKPVTKDCTYLLQPIRLEKLLSRDEKYLRDYPKSLPQICKDYVADLEAEGQSFGADEDEVRITKKALGGQLFPFVRHIVDALKGMEKNHVAG